MKPVDDISAPVRRVMPMWLAIERLAWAVGIGALALWGGVYVAGIVGSRQDVKRFDALKTATIRQPGLLAQTSTPDFTLWDIKRIGEWRDAMAQPAAAPLAVLRIPKIKLEVAILPGTDDFVLNRAAGHIDDTALPGANGNSGIAAHRDGFFRGLKDISMGDTMVLETATGTENYVIDSIKLVTPDDVSVLKSEPAPALTLVTCYPFYFIGSAPQRYIVHASLKGETKTLNEPAKASLQATASRTKENTQ